MNPPPAWVEGARHAPSYLNTQPWHFVGHPDDRIEVCWVPERTLPAADPDRIHLYLSLGAAIEGACLAGGTAGRALHFIPDIRPELHRVGWLVPSAESVSKADVRLAAALAERQTCRTPHLRIRVTSVILTAMRRETIGWHCRLLNVDDPRKIRQLARLAGSASAAALSDVEAHRERWRWLHFHSENDGGFPDGVSDESLELRGARRLAFQALAAPVRLEWLRYLGVHRVLASSMTRLVRHTAVMCLLTAPSHEPEDLVQTGRLFLRLWLLASEGGYGVHPLSDLVLYEPARSRVLQLFEATGSTPAIAFRMGMCPPVAPSSRYPAVDLVTSRRS